MPSLLLSSRPQDSFPYSLYAEHNALWYGISLWLSGVSCSGCDPSQLWEHSQRTHWQSMRSCKVLDLVQVLLSNNQTTNVLPTSLSS